MGAMKTGTLAAVLCALTGMSAFASDGTGGNELAIELNTVSDDAGGCKLTFMVTNNHAIEIDKLVFETVLFDSEGSVMQLTLFDFGKLPSERLRVRQFAVPQTSCATVGRILFNGLHTCEAEGLDPEICGKGVVPTSRTDIEVLG